MIGLNPRKVPAKMGRPAAPSARRGAVETHVALLAEDPSGQAQSAALATIGTWAKGRWGPTCRAPGAAVPGGRTAEPDQASRRRGSCATPATGGTTTPLWALAAVGGDQFFALGPNLASGSPAFVIAGARRAPAAAPRCLTMTRSLLSIGDGR